jgi:hypothetical protein
MMKNGTVGTNRMSSSAKKACKALYFSPKYWEPINADRPAIALEDNEAVMRCWNGDREVILTAGDLRYADIYL